ncbi:hypothetical protein [Georgenia yuyongxinii]
MTGQVIIDAGPALNFCSINKERLLISVTGPLKAPETVDAEVLRKARRDNRFERSEDVWRRLRGSRHLEILADDEENQALSRAVAHLSGAPLHVRGRQAEDLGEIMVLAHAEVLVQSGVDVTVLIDEGLGRRLAVNQARRLRSARPEGVGTLYLMSTITVLDRAIGTPHLPDKATLRETYKRLSALDDGIPHDIKTTNLLNSPRWSSA